MLKMGVSEVESYVRAGMGEQAQWVHTMQPACLF